MDTERIAELLQPFLQAPIPSLISSRYHSEPAKADGSDRCHSEPAKAGEEPASLSPAQFLDISTYIDILLRWNARINLTAIRDPEDIVPRHFGESLFAARHLFPSYSPVSSASSAVNSSCSVADIGSGAGFPGLPLKLWAPQVSLTLIESNHKKATFLREVVRSLTLTDVNIRNIRAEELSETFDLITLRAVDDFISILPTAAALVAPGGRLALLIGSSQVAPALALLDNFSAATPIPVPQSRTRVLAVLQSRTR